jgi:hypothetical protein
VVTAEAFLSSMEQGGVRSEVRDLAARGLEVAKRVMKNQRGFMKDDVHAMAPPHGTTHAAWKTPVKSAA